MSNSAKVDSLELLKRFKVALARYGMDAQAALGQADLEIRRVHDTLEDRLRYWHNQVSKRQEAMSQARADLSHARAMHDGKNIGTVEQEIALRKAKERLREAEEKVVITKRWLRDLPVVVKDLETPARCLSGYLETDLRQAVALLENKIRSLEAYAAIAAPTIPTVKESS